MQTQTLSTPDGTLAVVTCHEGTLLSSAREAATDALIALLERPARAVLVDTAPTADPSVYKATYRAQETRYEYDAPAVELAVAGPALVGASQPSLFSS
jgi:hypothetical protein